MIELGNVTAGFILASSLAVTVFAFFCLWLISLKLQDASVVDQYWAVGFAVIGWLSLGLSSEFSSLAVVLLFGVTAWALRLGIYLSLRHMKMAAEDARYTRIRKQFSPGFWWKSLPLVFMLQAVLMWLIALPLHAVFVMPSETVLTGVFWIGMIVFAAGAIIEAIADRQLASFKRSHPKSDAICRDGLWGKSRHPNYFGESLTWFGIGLCAFALTQAWWVFLGPALITFLLVKVSGLPPLEKHMAITRPDFPDYVREVRAFMLLPTFLEPIWDRGLTLLGRHKSGSQPAGSKASQPAGE